MSDPVERVAVVTGANRGLGSAIGQALAEAALRVVLTGRDAHAADRAAAQLSDLGLAVTGHQLDVTDPASVVRAMADTGYQFGRIDVLVNNAGVAIDRQQLAGSADMEKVRATLDANIMGAWRCCTAALPEMRKHGYGRIVNVTTHLASFGHLGTGSVSYRVSKAGLNALTGFWPPNSTPKHPCQRGLAWKGRNPDGLRQGRAHTGRGGRRLPLVGDPARRWSNRRSLLPAPAP